jgi:uncharacterized protein with PIN domain
MVIDSSAILAILQDEPERHLFNQAIAAADRRRFSALSLLEVTIVVEARFGSEAQQDLDLFLATAEIVVVPFDLHLAQLALSAFQIYCNVGIQQHRILISRWSWARSFSLPGRTPSSVASSTPLPKNTCRSWRPTPWLA